MDVYKEIQKLLMRKNQECGELQHLSSRTTTANVHHIDDVCKSVVEVFRKCDIPIGQNDMTANENCVQSYKYLVLNTYFKNQERLGEDIINGHLVDMCPPLSPYLLMQIVWNLGYERILIKSLTYLPLDLCAELLEIMRKCVEQLPFERSISIIYETMINMYDKFCSLEDTGLQSANVTESIGNSLANFQEFILLLTNPKIIRLTEVSELKKYERYGIVFKKLISTIRKCLEKDTAAPSADLEKLYKLTFGREPYVKCDAAFVEETVNSLNQDLASLLLKKIKEIDCNIYLGWAELDDVENTLISLQRSIGNDCYYLLEFLRNDKRLSEDTHLIECLQQLSSKPDSEQSGFVLTLQELCHAVANGKREHVKDLMLRYREWDESVLDFVFKNKSLLDKDDCLTLLEFLTFVLTKCDREDFKQLSYPLITKIILLQSIPDIYEIAIEYIIKHNGKNHLECQYTEEAFHDFITRNSNLRTPRNLRIILLFLLKNARLVLTTLLKITIGHSNYGNIMISPNDLLLLSPFMSIREENNQIIFTSILRSICMENVEWNAKKFMELIRVALENSVVKTDDLMNNVFIPYLESTDFHLANTNSILNNIRKLQTKCTKSTNIKHLIIALARKMSFLRKNRSISKYSSSELFAQITRILGHFLVSRSSKISAQMKREIVDAIESTVEPVDKHTLTSLWHKAQKSANVIDVMDDYERRCFLVVNKLREDPKTSERLRTYLMDFSFRREDFLRHLIVRSTDAEYHKFVSELTVMYGFVLGWDDEVEACNNLLRVTVDVCCMSLEYPSIGPQDLFLFLLKSLVRFCKAFVRLRGMSSPDEVHLSLIRHVKSLEASIKHSPYASLFAVFLARLNDAQQESTCPLQDVLNMLERFVCECFEFDCTDVEVPSGLPHSTKISSFFVAHEIISACLKVPTSGAYECIAKMNELFASN